METTTTIQEEGNLSQKQSNKKTVIKAVGIILSFYIAAIVIAAVIPENNFKAQFILMILPAIAVIVYGYWAATKENYLILKVVFTLLLISTAVEWTYRIISKL